MSLPRVNLIFQAPLALAIIIAILASPLITVFAPSLTARPAGPVSRTLQVPTLNLTTDAVLNDFVEKNSQYGIVSGTWDKAALGPFYLRILWVGRFQMDVPRSANTALLTLRQLCSALTSIPTRLTTELRILRATFLVFQDPPAAYLLAYDSTLSSSLSAALNFTAQDQYAGLPENLAVTNDQYGWTLAYVPFAASNANSGVLINAAGSICTFYNATHEVRTHFFNGTQETQVSVVEFGDL
ncbi:hypothetical protein K438DRAFT_809531 [Mycena galopus ATCC 62051]|nr:hypothetical protein K438DRAFT_809531 [Mycena galopus ATCC 62051]